MCNAKDWMQSPLAYRNVQQKHQFCRRFKVRVHCLIIRRMYEGTKTDNDMELKNLKLYLENRSIFEENEKLREKAIRLRRENIALLSEFQKKCHSCQMGHLTDY